VRVIICGMLGKKGKAREMLFEVSSESTSVARQRRTSFFPFFSDRFIKLLSIPSEVCSSPRLFKASPAALEGSKRAAKADLPLLHPLSPFPPSQGVFPPLLSSSLLSLQRFGSRPHFMQIISPSLPFGSSPTTLRSAATARST